MFSLHSFNLCHRLWGDGTAVDTSGLLRRQLREGRRRFGGWPAGSRIPSRSHLPRIPIRQQRGTDSKGHATEKRFSVEHLVAMRGSRRQYKHPAIAGRVTIAGKMSDDLAPGTLDSILKQATMKGTQR
jgi:hypothetical protein